MGMLAAWGPTIIAVIAALMTVGGYLRNVRENTKRIDSHDVRLEKVDTRLDEHTIAIAEGKAWRRGFEYGQKRSGSSDV